MRVLLINDDYWHPGIVSDEGVKPLAARGFQIDTISDSADFDAAKLKDYAVVLFAKSDNRTAKDQSRWMTEAIQQALTDYVRGGGGLVAIHSATVFREFPGMRKLLGGVFMGHPEQLPVTFEPRPGHPLTEGVETFTERDEHYFMDMDDQFVDVFLTSTSRHGTLPAGWAKQEGRGRVCVLTPGHNVPVWLHPSYQRLLENTLNWCAGR